MNKGSLNWPFSADILFSFWNDPQQDECSSLEEAQMRQNFTLRLVVQLGVCLITNCSFACAAWPSAFWKKSLGAILICTPVWERLAKIDGISASLCLWMRVEQKSTLQIFRAQRGSCCLKISFLKPVKGPFWKSKQIDFRTYTLQWLAPLCLLGPLEHRYWLCKREITPVKEKRRK